MITTQTSKIAEAKRLAERRDALLRIQAELTRIAMDEKTGLFIVATANEVLAHDASVTAEVVQLMMATQSAEMYNVMVAAVNNEIAAANAAITEELEEDQQQP